MPNFGTGINNPAFIKGGTAPPGSFGYPAAPVPGPGLPSGTDGNLSGNCSIDTLDYEYIHTNLQVPGALAFADQLIILKNPRTAFMLVSALAGFNLWMHFVKLNKATGGGAIIITGFEEWIPFRRPSAIPGAYIKFCKPITTFYLTGDGGGALPADMTLFTSSDLDFAQLV